MTQDQFVARMLAKQNALRMMAEEYKSKDYLAQLSEKEVKIIRKALVRISLDLPKDDAKCALELIERLSESSTGYPSKSNWKDGRLYFPTDQEKNYLVKNKIGYFVCRLDKENEKLISTSKTDTAFDDIQLYGFEIFSPYSNFLWIELP